MKTLIWLVSIFTAASVYAEPSAPTAEQVGQWAVFSKPVHLKAKQVRRGEFVTQGDAVWIYGYSAKEETLTTHVIGLYKAGTLFGKNRGETEKRIVEQIDKLKELAKQYPGQDSEEMAKNVRIETRPDGRKVFFSIMGFGPGGAAVEAFTTVGQYDVLLVRIGDSEDGVPKNQKLKNPAQPTKGLPAVFKELEQYVITAN